MTEARMSDVSGRRGILTLALHHVRTVHAGSRDLDQHLSRSRNRPGPFNGDERVGLSRLSNLDRNHGWLH
jgi:hypothetical protein